MNDLTYYYYVRYQTAFGEQWGDVHSIGSDNIVFLIELSEDKLKQGSWVSAQIVRGRPLPDADLV